MAESWYLVSRKEIAELPGGSTVLQIYKGSLKRALADTYPDVPFDEAKFGATSSTPFSNFACHSASLN